MLHLSWSKWQYEESWQFTLIFPSYFLSEKKLKDKAAEMKEMASNMGEMLEVDDWHADLAFSRLLCFAFYKWYCSVRLATVVIVISICIDHL